VNVDPSPSVDAAPAPRAAARTRFGDARRRWPVARHAAPRTIAGSALWLVSSNVLYAACQWGTIVALAKLGAPVAIGHLGLALAVATPVVLLSSLGLRSVQATDVARRYAFAEYVVLRLILNLVAATGIATAALLGMIEPAAVAILIPIGVAKIAEASSETCYGLAQRHERMRYVAISRASRGALGLVALATIVALGGSLAAGAWALAAAWSAFLFVVDVPVVGRLEPIVARPRLDAVWRLARESAPLGGVNGLFAAGQSLPRYLLGLSHGATAVGYFTALGAITPALAQLASTAHAAAPRLGLAAVGDRRRFRRLVLQLVAAAATLGGALVIGAALAGGRFLALAYDTDYAAFQTTFVIIVGAASIAVVNEVFYFALVASRRAPLQLAIECVAIAVTATGGLVLIPRLGVAGAALATAGGTVARATLAGTLVLRWAG
jgi:O-antigen/teichoic acid export membrane protein